MDDYGYGSGGGLTGGGYGGGRYDRFSAGGWGATGRDYGRDFSRGYDENLGDRLREGWHDVRDRARRFFRR
ncbi:MAG TPA: hypothetical protein VF092_02475 [Longimicrobium sp.]